MRASLRSRLPLLTGTTLLGLLALGFTGSSATAQKEKEDVAEVFARLQRGLTAEQVRQRVGPPRRIARQILYHRYLEQWVYGPPSSARLVFDCPRGQQPQLVSIVYFPPHGGEPGRGRKPH